MALSWTLDNEEAELALRLSGALRWFWRARGYYGEGRRWLEQALSEEGRTRRRGLRPWMGWAG